MKNFFYLFLLLAATSCTATRQPAIVKPVTVNLITDSGTIVLRLYDKTPLHKNNFMKLVKEKFYDGLLFHRVIDDFMIQGGDPDSRKAEAGALLGTGALKYTLPPEFDTSLFHKKGALAAARENDEVNPKRVSSSTQFYIVEGQTFTNSQLDRIEQQYDVKIPETHRTFYRTVGGTPFLDMKYTVFGEVISGMDVVRKIARAPRDENNRPLNDIRMRMSVAP